MSELLRAEGVHKAFGRLGAVRGVDLRIQDGDSLAIIGRSGSGKSTLLNLLAGLDAVGEGHIFYRGQDITTMERRRPRPVAAPARRAGVSGLSPDPDTASPISTTRRCWPSSTK